MRYLVGSFVAFDDSRHCLFYEFCWLLAVAHMVGLPYNPLASICAYLSSSADVDGSFLP